MNSEYHLNDAPYGTHKLVAQEIGSGQAVLDVGCNKGYFKSLIDQSNKVYGIDLEDSDLATAEANGYYYVEKVDLNNCSTLKLRDKFDVIVFADVLEHLLNPVDVLRYFTKNHLKSGGRIIISLPNVAHITIRAQLLFGRFSYTDAGILDRTHLHFYTQESAREFVGKSGLVIVKEKATSNRFGVLFERVPFLKTLLAFNFIFVCKKSESL